MPDAALLKAIHGILAVSPLYNEGQEDLAVARQSEPRRSSQLSGAIRALTFPSQLRRVSHDGQGT
jgi:hypothetical protein